MGKKAEEKTGNYLQHFITLHQKEEISEEIYWIKIPASETSEVSQVVLGAREARDAPREYPYLPNLHQCEKNQ